MRVPSTTLTSARLLKIQGEVRARLAAICADMPAPLFDQMVERIALVQLTYEWDAVESMRTRLR